MSEKTTAKLTADGQEIEVELKPLTVLCHQGEINLKSADPDLVEITPETTLAYARDIDPALWTLLRIEPYFMELWATVWGEYQPPEDLQGSSPAVRHVTGLIMLCLYAMNRGKTPFIRLPETYLHPKQQVGLADLFNTMRRGPKGAA